MCRQEIEREKRGERKSKSTDNCKITATQRKLNMLSLNCAHNKCVNCFSLHPFFWFCSCLAIVCSLSCSWSHCSVQFRFSFIVEMAAAAAVVFIECKIPLLGGNVFINQLNFLIQRSHTMHRINFVIHNTIQILPVLFAYMMFQYLLPLLLSSLSLSLSPIPHSKFPTQ